MVCNNEFHDTNEKVLFKDTNNEILFDANNTCEEDLEKFLINITTHSNTSVFISKQLIQRFVTSNPSPTYINDVASVFKEHNGDFKKILMKILTHEEAKEIHKANDSFNGKVKSPILRLAALYRVVFNPATNHFKTPEISQKFMLSPTVFGYFTPDFTPNEEFSSQGKVAPELQMVNDNQIIGFSNAIYELLEGRKTIKVKFDSFLKVLYLNDENKTNKRLVRKTHNRLIKIYNRLFLAGNMSVELKSALRDILMKETKDIDKVKHSLWFLFNSPEQAILR